MVVLAPATPVLRIFDEAKAREFYVNYLGFKIDFEHRFGENYPLYMGLSRANCRLHLSEHHGDASPGAGIRIETDDVVAFVKELQQTDYRFAKPGQPSRTPWGTAEICLTDPFANRLTFFQVI